MALNQRQLLICFILKLKNFFCHCNIEKMTMSKPTHVGHYLRGPSLLDVPGGDKFSGELAGRRGEGRL